MFMSVQALSCKVAILLEFEFMGQLDWTKKERSPAIYSSALEDLWMGQISGKQL